MSKKNILSLLLLAFLFAGCASYQETIYLTHDEILNRTEQKNNFFEFRIQPKDELIILVSTTDPASSVPFLRKMGQSKEMSQTSTPGEAKLLNYLVDNEGYIDYPVLGRLHVSGLSADECQDLIRKKLEAYLNEEPNVTVRIANFKVSVLGEVTSPGTYKVSDEGINIFQALAEAGDMTLFANRKDVQLLREDSTGHRRVIHLDLTSSEIALSPYYHLKQNDVVYVKPTKGKVRSRTFGDNTSAWITLVSAISSIVSLVIIAIR